MSEQNLFSQPFFSPGKRRAVWLLVLVFLSVASLFFSCVTGSAGRGIRALADAAMSLASGENGSLAAVVLGMRLERAFAAFLTGGALALAGCLMQALLRNPLADPYVLGVSSGASTGAVIAIIWGWFSFFGNYNVSAGAFIGAAVSMIIVTMCAGKSTSPIRLILVGMGVSALFSALTMMIIYGAKHEAQVRSAMFWLLGSLSGMQWSSLPTVAAAVFIMLAAVWILRSDLDLMLLGEGEAEYLGMNRKKLQLFIVILSSLIVAILVSKAGIIGFIGLITPHLARTAAGPSHGRLALFSALIGAIVMIWADVLSRALFAPEEVPIGVLTSIVGAPIFLWIVTHRYGEVQP